MNRYLDAMKNYAGFQGRASRAEFWLFTLVATIVIFLAVAIDYGAISGPGSQVHPFAGIVVVAHILPSLAVAVRRLHDTGRSGWWWLINVVPLGSIVLLVWCCSPGTPGQNRFGQNPLGLDAIYTPVPAWRRPTRRLLRAMPSPRLSASPSSEPMAAFPNRNSRQ